MIQPGRRIRAVTRVIHALPYTAAYILTTGSMRTIIITLALITSIEASKHRAKALDLTGITHPARLAVITIWNRRIGHAFTAVITVILALSLITARAVPA